MIFRMLICNDLSLNLYLKHKLPAVTNTMTSHAQNFLYSKTEYVSFVVFKTILNFHLHSAVDYPKEVLFVFEQTGEGVPSTV